MPTYEYQCADCGRKVEYFQSFKEEPKTECPECHGRLNRLVSSGAGLIFKGSGFYITDYKKGSSSSPASTSQKSETTTETKTESKPAESKPEPAVKE